MEAREPREPRDEPPSKRYESLSREELLAELSRKDSDLAMLKAKQQESAASTESQITEIMNR